jgi:hypothetical protein
MWTSSPRAEVYGGDREVRTRVAGQQQREARGPADQLAVLDRAPNSALGVDQCDSRISTSRFIRHPPHATVYP